MNQMNWTEKPKFCLFVTKNICSSRICNEVTVETLKFEIKIYEKWKTTIRIESHFLLLVHYLLLNSSHLIAHCSNICGKLTDKQIFSICSIFNFWSNLKCIVHMPRGVYTVNIQFTLYTSMCRNVILWNHTNFPTLVFSV